MWRSSTGHSAVHKRCCYVVSQLGSGTGLPALQEAHLHDRVYESGEIPVVGQGR